MELVCPTCPLCGSAPDEAGGFLAVITGGAQIFCANERCDVIMWDGTLPDGGLSAVTILPDEPDEHGVLAARAATPEEVTEAIERSRGEA